MIIYTIKSIRRFYWLYIQSKGLDDSIDYIYSQKDQKDLTILLIIYTIKSIRRFFSLYKHVQSKGLDLFRIYSFLSLIIIKQQWANMISTEPYLSRGVTLFLSDNLHIILSFFSFWQQMIKKKERMKLCDKSAGLVPHRNLYSLTIVQKLWPSRVHWICKCSTLG